MPTLVIGIKSVASMYRWASFCIVTAKMDGKFEAIHGDLADLWISLNEAACNENIGEIEHFICTLKEWMHAIYNTLPFTNIPL